MSENSEKLDKICTTLDKLTLEALLLMEEHIQLKLNIENAMISGETNLAKARYIMGQTNVSYLQLPTENGPEIEPLVKVSSSEDEKIPGAKYYEVSMTENSKESSCNPSRWFGILTPQNLTLAQNMYRQALQWAVQAATAQSRLWNTLGTIGQMKKLKSDLIENK